MCVRVRVLVIAGYLLLFFGIRLLSLSLFPPPTPLPPRDCNVTVDMSASAWGVWIVLPSNNVCPSLTLAFAARTRW